MLKSKRLDNGLIEIMAKAAGIDLNLGILLVDRGCDTVEKMKKFLHPTFDDLTPVDAIEGLDCVGSFLIDSMLNKKKILIYGDYDCDGICSIAMLVIYFRTLDYEIEYLIPDRNNDGYGLNSEMVKKILAMNVDVVVTVDCGIGSKDEVATLMEHGIEVAVTDHHEMPSELPKCLVCNPKSVGGSAADMCSAGIVLRLIEAMGGKIAATELIDIAAIATIADMVPLTGDNRIIAKLGLDKINLSPRLGVKLLSEKAGKTGRITASDIGFAIAPRINAAGRMKSALEVPKLFFDKDYFEIDALTDRLGIYNKERQELCEVVYNETMAYIKSRKIKEIRCVIYCGENWEVGVLGIACARVSRELNVPTILFAKKGDELKGSARGINGVNLYAELKKAKHLTLSFGGHSGACGVTINAEFLPLYTKVVEFNFNSLDHEIFSPKPTFDYEIVKGDINYSLCSALNDLEPCGMENRKSTFLYRDRLNFERIKLSEHMKANLKTAEILGFSLYKHNKTFSENCKVNYYLDLSLNEYRGNYTPTAFVKDFYIMDIYGIFGDNYDVNYYKAMLIKKTSYDDLPRTKSLDNAADEVKGNFGSVFVARRIGSAKKFMNLVERKKNRNNLINITFDALKSEAPFNSLIFYGGGELNLSGFADIIFLDPSPYGINDIDCGDSNVSFCSDADEPKISENDIADALTKINEYLFIVNDVKEGIDGVQSLYLLLQKDFNYDMIKFSIIFNILYARRCIEVTNSKLKTFYLKVNENRISIPTAYDMWINGKND